MNMAGKEYIFQEENDWKTFEKNNRTIALNVLHAKKKKNIPYLCLKT